MRSVIPKSKEDTIPQLPKSGWRRSFEREYLERKSSQLQTYLRSVLELLRGAPVAFRSPLLSFLAVNPGDKHPLVQRPRMGARPAAPLAPSPTPSTSASLDDMEQIKSGRKRAPSYKVVLLGDTAVGKSSIAVRFVRDQFERHLESTIGAAFLSQTLIVKGKKYKFEIWDTAGQERYHSLAPLYYRGAAVAIVVYDITKPQTFARAEYWVKELRESVMRQ